MGMPIDEVRTALGKERKYALHENKQAFDIAMNVMHKYQQIEQIIDDWNNGKFSDAVGCLRVKAVVEDGKTD